MIPSIAVHCAWIFCATAPIQRHISRQETGCIDWVQRHKLSSSFQDLMPHSCEQVAVPIVTRYIPKLEKPFLLAWMLGFGAVLRQPAVPRNQHVTGSAFSNLSATALYREATLKGMQQLAPVHHGELMPRLPYIPAVPEPDGVLYPSSFNNGTDAPSIAMVPGLLAGAPLREVCDVFVCSIWKAAGLFAEIENDFSGLAERRLRFRYPKVASSRPTSLLDASCWILSRSLGRVRAQCARSPQEAQGILCRRGSQ